MIVLIDRQSAGPSLPARASGSYCAINWLGTQIGTEVPLKWDRGGGQVKVTKERVNTLAKCRSESGIVSRKGE